MAVLTADDKDGGSGAASTALQIQKRPSSLTCGNASTVFGFPVTLSAQLADALPGAQLGGRRLTFRVGTATELGSGTTSGMGLGSVQSPGTLAPGQYTVTRLDPVPRPHDDRAGHLHRPAQRLVLGDQ